MSDAEFIEELAAYRGTPTEVLQHAELMALLLPTLRADFALVERYRYVPQARLTCPILALAGSQDEISASQVAEWAAETDGPFEIEWLDDGHFFVNSSRAAVVAKVRDALDPAVLAARMSTTEDRTQRVRC